MERKNDRELDIIRNNADRDYLFYRQYTYLSESQRTTYLDFNWIKRRLRLKVMIASAKILAFNHFTE